MPLNGPLQPYPALVLPFTDVIVYYISIMLECLNTASSVTQIMIHDCAQTC